MKKEKIYKYLFKKLQREQGLLERDCDKLVKMIVSYGQHAWFHVGMLTQW